MFPRRVIRPAALLVLLVACGDRPQRIGSGVPAASGPAPVREAAAPPVRFAGTVVLEGDASVPDASAVFVSARRKGQRLPALSRRFGMKDPEWSMEDGNRVLRFRLTDQDDMGGFNTPLGAEMEVEALYAADGFINTTPGAGEDRVVKVAVPASPGDRDLEIRIRLDAGG